MEKHQQYHEQYAVGIYCRLSKDDLSHGDSSSITSQKLMLEQYVRNNGWSIYDYYVDDGYTGTNYDRPGFKRMIDDIEAGKINMVTVKDLSRLGRNYILTGQYTDIYFPDRNVRFVALNDGIDTKNNENSILPFKNILNQMYSEDISKKVRSAIRMKKEKGQFVSSFAPYGYRKDPKDHHKLIVDEQAAAIVKRIFEMCVSGSGSRIISRTLTAEGILTPSNYRKKQLDKPINSKRNRWNVGTIVVILRNRMYLGDMVQGMYECSRFRRIPNKLKPVNDWLIIPQTHEPIVTAEIWEHAQSCLNSRKRVLRTNEVQLFAGFVRCADCGHALSYAYCQGIPQYTCGEYRRYGKNGCSCHYVRKDTLEQAVLSDIRRYAMLAKDKSQEFAQYLSAMDKQHDEKQLGALKKELTVCITRDKELNKIMKRLYEDNIIGRLTDERFAAFLSEYESEQAGIKPKIEQLETEIANIEANKKDSTAWAELIRNYTEIKELDRFVLSELIDKITVSETKIVNGEKSVDITIYYRFVGVIA